MPELYIIAGSNGAGKSSIGQNYIPAEVLAVGPIFDGDKLFMQKHLELWLSGIRVTKEAKRMADEYVDETFQQLVHNAITNGQHFVYEGHFTEEASWDVPRMFKAEGYRISMIFFGLSNTDVSDTRVRTRVKEGGHNVPRLMLENNYYGNLEKLNEHFELFHSLRVFDTSTLSPVLLADANGDQVSLTTSLNDLPDWFRQYLPALFAKGTHP
jgi:predicted ABC-type ATPase